MYLGDRPLSGMGAGKPVDVFDKICQDYKNCQKCAREEHGETCIGEFINYPMDTTHGKVLKCKSKGGSCERELCECDKKFAQGKIFSDRTRWQHVFSMDFNYETGPRRVEPSLQSI